MKEQVDQLVKQDHVVKVVTKVLIMKVVNPDDGNPKLDRKNLEPVPRSQPDIIIEA